MSKDHNNHDSGSFLSGLSIGLIGGAAGYFLFATDKGDKLRKRFAAEWQELQKIAKPELANKQNNSESLRDLLGTFFNEMLEQSRAEQAAATEEAKNKKKKTKKKLFKGVG